MKTVDWIIVAILVVDVLNFALACWVAFGR